MNKARNISLLFGIAILLLSTISYGQKKSKKNSGEYNASYNYEVTTVAVGIDGTKLVKVWGFGKKPDVAIQKAKKDAIACAIFKGYPAGTGRIAAKTPAIVNESGSFEKNKEFYSEFFASEGKYLQYVNRSSDAPPSGADRLKVRKGYKVGITVSIAFNELRKYLEDEGIARKLDTGF